MKCDLEWTLEMVRPEDVASVDIMVDYDYRGGGFDYFAYGCWNPGDPCEIEITRVAVGEHVGPGRLDFEWRELSLLPTEERRVLDYIAENPPEDPYYEDDY